MSGAPNNSANTKNKHKKEPELWMSSKDSKTTSPATSQPWDLSSKKEKKSSDILSEKQTFTINHQTLFYIIQRIELKKSLCKIMNIQEIFFNSMESITEFRYLRKHCVNIRQTFWHLFFKLGGNSYLARSSMVIATFSGSLKDNESD
jgi:hypothetical protein